MCIIGPLSFTKEKERVFQWRRCAALAISVPHCGKAVLHQRSVFALSAAAARMECECGQEALEAGTDGVKFRLWVPCGVCGGHHQAECSADAVLHGRGIGLACPEKQEICCYIGGGQQVRHPMEELAPAGWRRRAGGEEAFTDNVIMYEKCCRS